MRSIMVIYGPVDEANSAIKYGCDLYAEVKPKQWSRLVDLPNNHPANLAASRGSLKAASMLASDGCELSALNAFDAEHRELAAKEGLRIPFGENDPVSIIGPASTVPDTTPSSERYNEVMKHTEDVRRQLQQQTRNVSAPDKNDLLQRVNMLREKMNVLEDDDSSQKLLFMERLNELMQKIQTTKNEDYAAKRAYLKMRVARLQQDITKQAEDEDLEAQRTPKDADDFIQASISEILGAGRMFNQTKAPPLAAQLETLFKEYALVDFKGYFEDPRKMERLRALSWL